MEFEPHPKRPRRTIVRPETDEEYDAVVGPSGLRRPIDFLGLSLDPDLTHARISVSNRRLWTVAYDQAVIAQNARNLMDTPSIGLSRTDAAQKRFDELRTIAENSESASSQIHDYLTGVVEIVPTEQTQDS